MARPAGFEPTTPWFVAKYSIQLSYGRCKEERLYHQFYNAQVDRHAYFLNVLDSPAASPVWVRCRNNSDPSTTSVTPAMKNTM